MGKQARIKVLRRLKKRVKWPEGFDGMVMWCPLCAGEIMRVPKGESSHIAEQRAAVAAHVATCKPDHNARCL